MIYIGIDPGLQGFICVGDDENPIEYHAIPAYKQKVWKIIKKKRKEVDKTFFDFHKSWELFKGLGEKYPDAHVGLEDVHALFGSAAGATFTFGGVYYAIQSFIIAAGFTYELIKPKEWQKEVWVDDDVVNKAYKDDGGLLVRGSGIKPKDTSINAVKRLYPNEDLRATLRCEVPHDGKVDSLLIYHYLKTCADD